MKRLTVSLALLLVFLLGLSVPAFSQGVTELTPASSLVERARNRDFSLKDTAEFEDLLRCGCFCEFETPAELREYLIKGGRSAEYAAAGRYRACPGDLLFSFEKGHCTAFQLVTEPGRIKKANSTIVHVEYPSYEELCYLYLRNELGLTKPVACGIMSNIYCESKFNPLAEEASSNPGYGICQWTGDRRAQLEQWCSEQGRNIDSLYSQLDFMTYELTEEEKYKSLLPTMKTVSQNEEGAYDAALLFCLYYENPYDAETLAEVRGQTARDFIYPEYVGRSY